MLVQLFQTSGTSLYAAHLWPKFTAEAIYQKTSVAYNNIFRKFMNVDRRASISAAFVHRNVSTFSVSTSEDGAPILCYD